MTDPFEDAVRAAGRGLVPPTETPTYHSAWRRGRRRRLAKRSAVVVVGACALVVAFGTDLGRFQGGTTTETDDLAVVSDAVPAPTSPVFEPTSTPAIPTTEPLDLDDTAVTAPDLDIDSADAAPTAVAAVVEPTTGAVPTSEQAPAPEPTPDPAASGPTAVPAPTAVPTSTPAETGPSDAPDDFADPEASASTLIDPDASTDPAPDEPGPNSGEGGIGDDGAVDPSGGTGPGVSLADESAPESLPPLAAAGPAPDTRLGVRADALVTSDLPTATGAWKCDVDGDGQADTLCEPLDSFACAAVDAIPPDYEALDVDGDGVAETCRPLVTTTCDLDADGLGDTICRIVPFVIDDASNLDTEIPDAEGP